MWKLVIEDDEGKRTVVPLTRDQYTIGRREGNTIRLTERNVSREHARLHRKASAPGDVGVRGGPEKTSYTLEDVSSYNGVYVNGLRVSSTQDLAHGDLIQIGDYRIVLQDDSVADAPPTTSVALDLKATVPNGSGRLAQAAQLLERPHRLVMLAGPTPGSEFPLDRERMTIGRAEDATISINHNSVSRLHCEVHALGDGRFEIVDKGSSNGVRVNSADLRRGIVEDGDVIELGDVRFKFVGAGKVFRPGVTESQQLSAIGDRTASSVVGMRRGASIVPYVVFGAVVAAGAVGAWAITRPRTDPGNILPLPSASASPESPERAVLDEAMQLCQSGDCDTAFEKLATELPEHSPLRSSDEALAIASRWAEKMMDRADGEGDGTKRRQLLEQVEKAPLVDGALKRAVAERLRVLEEPGAVPSPSPPFPRDGGPDGSPGLRRVPPPSPAASSGHPPPPRPPSPPRDEVWRQAMLRNDYAAARQVLEPRVFGSRPTMEEMKALKVVCQQQGDKACVDHVKQLQAPQVP